MLLGLWSLFLFSFIKGMTLLTSYIANNTFPQPLSEEEESKHISLMCSGEESSRNTLVEHNLRLVAHIVKKFESSGVDTDDLISIGTIGLIKALNTYKAEKGTRLATYAARCIENEILMHLRYMKKLRAEVSMFDPIGVDKEGNEITLIDLLGTHSEVVSEIVESKFELGWLFERVNHLNKREKKVLVMRFGLDDGTRKTQREIAKKLGISRSYVSRIEKRALSKLTKELNI